jgi:hypothetical protein
VQRHYANGHAQSGWWLESGVLLHDGGCVNRRDGIEKPRANLTPSISNTMRIMKDNGLTSTQITGVAAAIHGQPAVLAKMDVRNEMMQPEAPGIVSGAAFVVGDGGSTAAHYLQGLEDEQDRCLVSLFSVLPAGTNIEASHKTLTNIVTVAFSEGGKTRTFDVTARYLSSSTGPRDLGEWSVAEHVLLRQINKKPASEMPGSSGSEIRAVQELVAPGCSLRVEGVVVARYAEMRRAWRAMESQGFDTSGKVCNIKNANYLLMCALDAEGKQINTITGMLFSLTRQIFMFAITFAYPLLYGRAVYNHKITSTDGDSNEYSVVDFAASLAAVAKAAAGGTSGTSTSDAGDTAPKAKIKGHTQVDQFGRSHIYSNAECQWVCVAEAGTIVTQASVAMENAIALGHLGGHDHRSARDYFHAVVMTWKKATKDFTGYDKAMAFTALDWVKRICYDAATPTTVSQAFEHMVEWLQDPDRAILHSRLTQHKVPLPLKEKTLRDPEFKVQPATVAAAKTTAAIPTSNT